MEKGSHVGRSARVCESERYSIILSLVLIREFGTLMLNLNAQCPAVLYHGLRTRVVYQRPVEMTVAGKAMLAQFYARARASRVFYFGLSLEDMRYYVEEVCRGALREKNRRAMKGSNDGRPSRRALRISGFGKAEGTKVTKFAPDYDMVRDVLLGIGDAAPPTVPKGRFIAAMEREGNLHWARVVRPCEKRFYDMQGFAESLPHPPGSQRIFAKGLNSTETASLLLECAGLYKDMACLMLDASMADSTLRYDLHLTKFHFYSMMLSDDARAFMWDMVPDYLHPKFNDMKGTSLRVDGFLMSGVMDTALANNMCFWFVHSCFRLALTGVGEFAAITRASIPGFPTLELGPYDYLVILNGDDCLPFLEANLVDQIVPWIKPFYALFGVDMRVDGVARSFENIDFCQSSPIEFRPGEWKMVRKPEKVVGTTLCSMKWARLTPIDFNYRLGTIGVCELILNLGVPVLQSFSLMLIRNGSVKKLLQHDTSGSFYRAIMEMRKFGMRELRVMTPSPITDIARASFERAFGVAPARQRELEALYDSYSLPSDVVRMSWDMERGYWH